MSVDHIRYDLMVRDAMRGVVRQVLSDVAANGLPGDHHFFISFATGAPGVRISPRLRAQYPEEMTIVLQHQFWDLALTPTGFEVGLSFGGVAEKLGVPFDAIKGFFDPSVQFGLEFEPALEAPEAKDEQKGAALVPAAPGKAEQALAAPPASRPSTERRSARERKADRPAAKEASSSAAHRPAEGQENIPPAPAAGAEVVRLDRFRKK